VDSRRELVANSCTHRRRDATRQFRRVGVGGVYWALQEALLVDAVVDGGEMLPGSGNEDDRGQLAECLAFISDMALTGDGEGGARVDPGAAAALLPDTCQQQQQHPDLHDDDEAKEEAATGDPVDEETVPEPTDSRRASSGRGRWLRHRVQKLRVQRQRSAPGRPLHSASVDDSVNSHIQMLNSLDSQVREITQPCK